MYLHLTHLQIFNRQTETRSSPLQAKILSMPLVSSSGIGQLHLLIN